jgi:hypothetical protein
MRHGNNRPRGKLLPAQLQFLLVRPIAQQGGGFAVRRGAPAHEPLVARLGIVAVLISNRFVL